MLSFFVIVLRVAFCVLRVARCVLRLIVCPTGPRGKAAAVAAKNSPPDCFLHAPIACCALRVACCALRVALLEGVRCKTGVQ